MIAQVDDRSAVPVNALPDVRLRDVRRNDPVVGRSSDGRRPGAQAGCGGQDHAGIAETTGCRQVVRAVIICLEGGRVDNGRIWIAHSLAGIIETIVGHDAVGTGTVAADRVGAPMEHVSRDGVLMAGAGGNVKPNAMDEVLECAIRYSPFGRDIGGIQIDSRALG